MHDPEGELTKTISGTISSMPCATPWTSPLLGASVNVRLSADKKTVDRMPGWLTAWRGRYPSGPGHAEALVAGPAGEHGAGSRSGSPRQLLQDINPRDSWRAARDFRLNTSRWRAQSGRLCESVRLAGGEVCNGTVSAAVHFNHQRQRMWKRSSTSGPASTDMLRNDYHLTSVKKGCEVGECGACNVLIDGECFNSCIYLAVWAEGKRHPARWKACWAPTASCQRHSAGVH